MYPYFGIWHTFIFVFFGPADDAFFTGDHLHPLYPTLLNWIARIHAIIHTCMHACCSTTIRCVICGYMWSRQSCDISIRGSHKKISIFIGGLCNCVGKIGGCGGKISLSSLGDISNSSSINSSSSGGGSNNSSNSAWRREFGNGSSCRYMLLLQK